MFSGRSATTYTTPVHRVTLADLYQKAREHVDENLVLSPGRRTGVGESRAVESLNEKHLQRIRTACRAAVAHLHPEAKSSELDEKFNTVGAEYFVWNEEDEDWSKFLDLVRRACLDKSDRTRRQYVSSARRLLDLAATHGWISRTSRHDSDYEPVPAEWADLFNDWRERLTSEGVKQATFTLMTLFEACAECAFHPREANWSEVIGHLENRFRAAHWTANQKTRVRNAYRTAVETGLISGPEWDGNAWQGRKSTLLVRTGAIDEVGELYGRKKDPEKHAAAVRAALDGREVAWPEEFELYDDGLLAGPYGLKTALTFFVLNGSEADIAGFPQRVFPRSQIRSSHPNAQKPWLPPTVGKNLRHLLHCAGWMEENIDDVDWSKHDLRKLLRLENLDAYRRAVYAGRLSTKRALAVRLRTCARIASPFMEAAALENGDDELADRMAHLSATLCSSGGIDGRISWVSALEQELSQSDEVESRRRRAQAIEAAWTENGQAAEYAYQQLVRVREALVSQLEDDYGRLSQQIEAVLEGTRLGRTWARQVQQSLFWQEQTVVPLRARTLRLLDSEDRHQADDFSRIWMEIPAWKLKVQSNGPFRPNLTKGGAGYCRELYRLYVMPGGAREQLTLDESGEKRDREAFWVPDVKKYERERYDSGSLRRLMRRGLRRALRESDDLLNGPTFESLKDELTDLKAFGTHSFRHIFATFLVRQGNLQAAAKYLHHRGIQTLQEVYSGTTAAHYDVADILSEAVD